jgi:hypothetical protein
MLSIARANHQLLGIHIEPTKNQGGIAMRPFVTWRVKKSDIFLPTVSSFASAIQVQKRGTGYIMVIDIRLL